MEFSKACDAENPQYDPGFDNLITYCPEDKGLEILSMLYGQDTIELVSGLDLVPDGIETGIYHGVKEQAATLALDMPGSVMTGMLGIFNDAIILLGAAYILLMTIIGIGNATGKYAMEKGPFDSLLKAGRVVTGAASLLPVYGGLSLLQLFVLYAIITGGGVANTLQLYAITNIQQQGSVVGDGIVKPMTDYASHMFASNVCMGIVNSAGGVEESAYGKDSGRQLVSLNSSDKGISYDLPPREKVKTASDELVAFQFMANLVTGRLDKKAHKGFCGSIQFKSGEPTPDDVKLISPYSLGMFLKNTNTTSDEFLRGFYMATNSAHRSVLTQLNTNIRGLSNQFMMEYKAKKQNPAAVEQLRSVYSERLLQQAYRAQVSLKKQTREILKKGFDKDGRTGEGIKPINSIWTKMTARAIKDGWVYFGGWFYRLNLYDSKIQKISQNLPEYNPVKEDSFNTLPESVKLDNKHAFVKAAQIIKDMDQHYLKGLNLQVEMEKDQYYADRDQGNTLSNTEYLKNDEYFNEHFNSGRLVGTEDSLGDKVDGMWFTLNELMFGMFELNHSASPIVQVKRIGDYIITILSSILTVLLAAWGFSMLVSKTPLGFLTGRISGGIDWIKEKIGDAAGDSEEPAGVKGIALGTTMGLLLFAAVFSFLIFGITLSTYIPLIPVIVWITATIGWVIATIEILMASAVWGFAHLNSEGDGVVSQSARQGWLILFNVIMRPPMLVISIVFAMALSYIGIMLVNAMFVSSMTSMSTDSIASVFIGIGFIFVYVTLVLNIIHASYSVIHYIPNQVTRFIGGPSENVGNDFKQFENDSKQQIQQAGSKAEQAASQGFRSSGASMIK